MPPFLPPRQAPITDSFSEAEFPESHLHVHPAHPSIPHSSWKSSELITTRRGGKSEELNKREWQQKDTQPLRSTSHPGKKRRDPEVERENHLPKITQLVNGRVSH